MQQWLLPDGKKRKGNRTHYSSYNYLLEITSNGDKLFMNDLVYDYYYYNQETGNI